MKTLLIKSATIVNENKQFVADILIKDGFIEKIDPQIETRADREIIAQGLYLFPGCIDDQVHFREPGLTHKATIYYRIEGGCGRRHYFFYGNAQYRIPNALTQKLLA